MNHSLSEVPCKLPVPPFFLHSELNRHFTAKMKWPSKNEKSIEALFYSLQLSLEVIYVHVIPSSNVVILLKTCIIYWNAPKVCFQGRSLPAAPKHRHVFNSSPPDTVPLLWRAFWFSQCHLLNHLLNPYFYRLAFMWQLITPQRQTSAPLFQPLKSQRPCPHKRQR